MATLTDNRITRGIEAARTRIAERIKSGETTKAKVKALGKSLDMETNEYVLFQQLKSIASQDGRLTLDEAQCIYRLIGEGVGTYNRLPVAEKVVLTQVFQSLLR
jgi:hypothetical protein